MTTVRLLAFALCLVSATFAQRVGVPTTDLDNVSVDELFSVQVTSVDRKAQELAKAPAAVFVLTAADIRRSGATCIPEALELVPGLTVLRLDGRSWSVSAREGARQYSDKILVLIDGRSLYTPFFSGVIWDAIDVPLDDIEQIEVVRGPGAVMWGPNAVNGVINIITRNARNTKGGQASAAAGNEDHDAELRWGAAPNDQIAWRVWGKFDYLTPAFGSPGYYNFNTLLEYRAPDIRNLDSGTGRMGFRVDGQPGEKDQWLVEGDLFKTDRQDPIAIPIVYPVIQQIQSHSNYFGGYLQGSWTHTTSSGAENTLQISYDRTDLHYYIAGGSLNNLNVNYQSHQQTSERNEIYWGAGFQQYWDETEHSGWLNYNPPNSTYRAGDVVGRDEWQFLPGRLMGSAGIRLDYNSYHQLEYQPSLRLLYTPDNRQSAWVAVSRAVRTPNRVDRDFDQYAGSLNVAGLTDQLWMLGTKNMQSEVERSAEAGYRMQSGQRWSVDGSLFFSYYERLRAIDGTVLPALTFQNGIPTLLSTVYTCNCGGGRSYGAELWGTWQVRPGWRLSPSYSYLNDTRWLPSDPSVRYFWDGTPVDLKHQGFLRSQHDLTRTLQFDLTARARSRDDVLYDIPGVLLLDARLAWRPWRTGEFSLAVKNLTGREVMEGYPELSTVAIPIRRTYVLKWTQRF
jgi:iron complex outermembrane receptor protein